MESSLLKYLTTMKISSPMIIFSRKPDIKGWEILSNEESKVREPLDFAILKQGLLALEKATLALGDYETSNSQYGNKSFVLQAMQTNDIETIRAISSYFFKASGIYQRMCRYLANLYRYDWHVSVRLIEASAQSKCVKEFSKVLDYLDNSNVKL